MTILDLSTATPKERELFNKVAELGAQVTALQTELANERSAHMRALRGEPSPVAVQMAKDWFKHSRPTSDVV